MPTVCLALICRNEAGVVETLLDSVRPHISAWIAVDTGSTDGTQDIVRGALAELPGALIESTWRDFSSARNEALAAAEILADWVLMLDADNTLDGEIGDPEHDACLIEKVEPMASYRVPLLTRASCRFRYRRRVHEYLEIAGSDVGNHDAFRVIRHDGVDRPGKYERYRDLLLADLADDPADTRTVFYLAQTYEQLGDPAALDAYRRRSEMGGWEEERWFSAWRAAAIASDDQALAEAWAQRRSRSEPLYDLTVRARLRGDHEQALRWACLQPLPSTDLLFVARWVEEWALPFERACAMYRTGAPALAAAIFRRLIDERRMPAEWVAGAERNLAACAAGRTMSA